MKKSKYRGPEREDIKDVVRLLRKQKVKLFKRIADLLMVSRRRRAEVNVSKIARHTKEKSVVVVPGKVLAGGTIEHPVDIVCLSCSPSACSKIEKAGGNCRDWNWLIKRGVKEVIILK